MAKKTWVEFESDVVKLIKNMRGFKPDVIVPSMRGGLVPGALIAETLGVKDVRPISIERIGEERRIGYDVQGKIKGLKLLLVEDDLPIGIGAVFAKKFLEQKGAAVKISAVYVNNLSCKVVDFYGELIDPLPDLPWKPSRNGDRIVQTFGK